MSTNHGWVPTRPTDLTAGDYEAGDALEGALHDLISAYDQLSEACENATGAAYEDALTCRAEVLALVQRLYPVAARCGVLFYEELDAEVRRISGPARRPTP